MEEFESEQELLDFVEDSRTESLTVLGLFRAGREHQAAIDAFTDAEQTFRAYGHEDVVFGRARYLKKEHEHPQILIAAPHYKDIDHMSSMADELERNVSNIVRFAFFSLIPPYAKWPEFPDQRGTVDEVQRGRLHGRNDMPKVFVFMLKEFADEYGVRLHQTLEKVGEALTGYMVLIHVVPPEADDISYLQLAVYPGEEEQNMEILASGKLLLIAFDVKSKTRDGEARSIDSFNEKTLLGFCNNFLKMLPEEAREGRPPFPIKRADKRAKNTIGLGKYAKDRDL